MQKKEKVINTEKEKVIKIKYVGNSPAVEVPGLGYFLKDAVVTFSDCDHDLLTHAQWLVATNSNFEEVEK